MTEEKRRSRCQYSFGLFFDPEDGSDVLLHNVEGFYSQLHDITTKKTLLYKTNNLSTQGTMGALSAVYKYIQ
jgi:hypothetical protein